MSEDQETPSAPSNTLGFVYASLLARLWLGVRAVQTGVEKYAGSAASSEVVKVDGTPNAEGLTAAASQKVYALANYHGVPAPLLSKFQTEPLMPGKLLPLYDKVLGPSLVILGVAILLGLFYRSSLFLLGLLYISLTWGLILIKEDGGVAWLASHLILIVAALALAGYNRVAVLKKW
jgi:thiosulfate dehydrogenase [quinone] large subunit